MDTEFHHYLFLIVFSGLVILSYIFYLIARKFRLPSVLLLIGSGMIARHICSESNIILPPLETLLQIVGTLGLILIVLDGALDLKITRDSLPIIGRASACALFILLLTAVSVAAIFSLLLHRSYDISFVNALPFAVISSAIAIPGVAMLPQVKREFIIYESAMSDIVGILAFSLTVRLITIAGTSFFSFVPSLLLTILAAVLCSAILFVVILKNPHHIKFFLVLSTLILIYGVTKMFHLSSLLVIFLFGIAFANAHVIIGFLRLNGFFRIHQIKIESRFMRMITSESAFLIRTFFFMLFGYTIDLSEFSAMPVLIGLLVTATLLLARYLYLRIFARIHLFPELFVAPRGLVTVLLFYSLPASILMPEITKQVLFVVILLTSLIMTISLFIYQPATEIGETEDSLLEPEVVEA